MTPDQRPALYAYRGFCMRLPTAPPEHQPMQPAWICANCAQEWPCAPARERLLADAGGPTRLAMLMWTYLEQYAQDAGPGPLLGAFERFISWTRAK